jgi:hypothetical protein
VSAFKGEEPLRKRKGVDHTQMDRKLRNSSAEIEGLGPSLN